MLLYEIDIALMNCIDTDTGEIIDEETFNKLMEDKKQAIDNLVLLRKNVLADVAGIDAEINTLKELKESKKKYIERLEGYIDSALGGEAYKPESGLYEIKYTKSKECEVYDFDALIEWDIAGTYIRYGKPEPNKAEIKKAIASGKVIAGCSVIDKTNMKIK